MWRRFFYSVVFLGIVSSVLYFWTPSRFSHVDPSSQHIAQQALTSLKIIPHRDRIIGYERTKFGNGWGQQVGEHGEYCSTRHLVLNQSFDTEPASPCPKAIGEAVDEYTAKAVTPSDTDIDHIYPLAAAWDMGAFSWSDQQREVFADDWQHNLAITASTVNREKSDATLEEWLPPLAKARCPYVARYLSVAVRYGLVVSRADADSARLSVTFDAILACPRMRK